MKWIDWVGHYKNILSVELCNQIINYKFNYVKSTYSTHKGLSPNEKRVEMDEIWIRKDNICLLYTSPSPRDVEESRMPSSA